MKFVRSVYRNYPICFIALNVQVYVVRITEMTLHMYMYIMLAAY